MELEVWRDVRGYAGMYQVSNLGRVKSLIRQVRAKNGSNSTRRGQILSNCNHPKGYLVVTLWKNGMQDTKLVHVLVAEAFIPNPAHKPEVNHKDTNKKNNKLSNLEWNTGSENIQHSIKHGTFKRSLRIS